MLDVVPHLLHEWSTALGRSVGSLYAINTFGAVTGVVVVAYPALVSASCSRQSVGASSSSSTTVMASTFGSSFNEFI